jgi:hypothetical protein
VIDIFGRDAEHALKRFDRAIAGSCGSEYRGRLLRERCEEQGVRCGFDFVTEEHQREACQAMLASSCFLDCELEEQGQIRDGTRGEFLFIECEEMGEVAAGRSGFGERRGRDVLQAKFGYGFREGTSEAGHFGDRREISQSFGRSGGVNNAGGESLDTETGDGREREAAQGLRGEIRGKLRHRERVQALATGRKGANRKLVGGGTGGRYDE